MYIIAVLVLTDITSIRLSDFNGFYMTPNLIPFVTTITDMINYPFIVLEQVLLNVIFFIPFGFLVAMLYLKQEKKILKILITALIFSAGIEILEFFAGRYMDIDDIIWNALGAMLGSYTYYLVNLFIRKTKTIKSLDSIKVDK